MTHFLRVLRLAALIPQVGIIFLSCLGVGIFCGYYLDLWLGVKPVFSLGFGFLGGVAGGLSVYRLLMAKGKQKHNGKS